MIFRLSTDDSCEDLLELHSQSVLNSLAPNIQLIALDSSTACCSNALKHVLQEFVDHL